MRKFLTIALGVVAVSTLSLAPASAADPPGWQIIGARDFYMSGSTCATSPALVAQGGYILTEYIRPGFPDDLTHIQIWEDDPDNADDYITTLAIKDGQAYQNLIEDYTDGDNGSAEIYYKGPCTGAPWVSVYD